MMAELHSRPTQSTTPGSRNLDVAVGLAGGALVRGMLRVPGTWRVCDMLNNVREPVLTLAGGRESPISSLTLSRSNLVWMAALGLEPVGTGDNDTQGAQSDHAVVVYAGPFELRGTITTHAGVDWSNFLLGRAGPPPQFFVLTGAHIVSEAEMRFTSLSVNVALVAAIATIN